MSGDRDRVSIPGVVVQQFTTHTDARGSLTEIFRSSWGGIPIRQWIAMSLGTRVIRGPSVHRTHSDAVIAVAGELHLGLRDLRQKSPAFRQTALVMLQGSQPAVAFIPPGVMHTFYAATEPTLLIVGTTHEYDADDDIKCRWQDAGLDLDESVIGTLESRARSLDDVIATLHGVS